MVIKRLETFLTFILEFFIMLNQKIDVIYEDGTSTHSKNKKKHLKQMLGNIKAWSHIGVTLDLMKNTK